MDILKQRAKRLLERGEVAMVIGFTNGTHNTGRPVFVRTPEQAEHLCPGGSGAANLAVYATKDIVKGQGRIAVVADALTQQALLQLMAEQQIKDGELLVLAAEGDGVEELDSAEALAAHIARKDPGPARKDRELLEKLAGMTREARWSFWQQALERCMKCYACRGACPMCYCGQCTMDGNRPQWVPVASHAQGNVEYHLVRAMHLAGRCVGCGACGRACPVGIPVHLFGLSIAESTHRQFGQAAGRSVKPDYALGTFKPDDREAFIR